MPTLRVPFHGCQHIISKILLLCNSCPTKMIKKGRLSHQAVHKEDNLNVDCCFRSKSACRTRRKAATPLSRCWLTSACSASTTWKPSGARSQSQNWNVFSSKPMHVELFVTQEYEELVSSSQQYQHLDNPIYRVCIEKAVNAGDTW